MAYVIEITDTHFKADYADDVALTTTTPNYFRSKKEFYRGITAYNPDGNDPSIKINFASGVLPLWYANIQNVTIGANTLTKGTDFNSPKELVDKLADALEA